MQRRSRDRTTREYIYKERICITGKHETENVCGKKGRKYRREKGSRWKEYGKRGVCK